MQGFLKIPQDLNCPKLAYEHLFQKCHSSWEHFMVKHPNVVLLVKISKFEEKEKSCSVFISNSLFLPFTATHINPEEGFEGATSNMGIQVKLIKDLPWVLKLQAQCSTVFSNP